MPIFEYKAFGPGGVVKSGVIDADTPRDARSKLKREELRVSKLVETRGGRKVSKKNKGAAGKPSFVERMRKARKESAGPSSRDQELLGAVTRQLATMLSSGIPLAEALKAIIEQADQKRVETLFREIREDIEQGASMADSLQVHPEMFSPLYVNMVRAGQATGNIDVVLSRLADYMQRQRALRRKVVSAMTYPALMISIGVIVVMILLAAVVPKVTAMLEDTGQTLPTPTRVLIQISDLVKGYWWLGCLFVAAVSTVLGHIYRKNKIGRLRLDRFMLRVPFIGDLLRKSAVARFTRTLSTLLQSGVPVTSSLEITESVVGNRVVADATGMIRSRILEGTDIATPLRASKAFPSVVGYMVAVGEQTGELEQMLDRIADAYDEEIEVATERLTSVLEPIMIVFLALIVGYIVISIILPILKVGQIQ